MEPFAQSPQHKGSTPLLILGILFIVTLGTSLVPARWFGIEPKTVRYATINLESLSQLDNVARDTNQDGTVSWKEYVANSLALSPEDIQKTVTVDPQGLAILNDENNITSSFTKNFYLASTALNQNGLLDETNKQDLVNQLVTEEVKKHSFKTYTNKDISRIADSPSAIKTYGNAFASALSGFITEDSIVQDLSSLNKYLGTADTTALIPLRQDASKLNTILTKVLALQVPESAVSSHLQALNILAEYVDMISGLSVTDTDAMRSTIAIKKYQEVTIQALRIYPLLGKYFSAQNVTFTSKEAGYIYVVGYTGIVR